MVDEKSEMSQQCGLSDQEAIYILDCIQRNVASRLKEVILPLRSCETSPGVLHPALLSPPYEHEIVAASPEESHEANKRTGTHIPQRQAEQVGAAQPGEGKAVWRPHNNLKYLKPSRGKLERNSVRSTSNRTRRHKSIFTAYSNPLTFYYSMINLILEESHSYEKVV
ncbi:hypothetical protein TURU_093425 [Turdus rufiventris]|nr:hypothetical protein TURU_093425 [Turdus rufiventris]